MMLLCCYIYPILSSSLCCYGYRVETTFELFTNFADIVPFTAQIDGSNLETYEQVSVLFAGQWPVC